jgi:hypothetical protein
MKTILKTLTALAVIGLASVVVAQAADQPTTPQTWGPGWRHEQMLKSIQDGTFTPGQGYGMRGGRGPGYGMMGGGPGYGRGFMAAAIGPDGKVDLSKLPTNCPARQALIDSQTNQTK